MITTITKRALLIGIPDYTHNNTELPDLPGVEKDVDDVRKALERAGYTDITSDPPAMPQGVKPRWTRDAIHKAFVDFKEKVNPGDHVVIYYSGHGARLTLWDKDGQRGKVVEALLASDFRDWDDPYNKEGTYSNYIDDDTLRKDLELLGEKEPELIEVILDCCYAAGLGGIDERPTCFCAPKDLEPVTTRCVVWAASSASADFVPFQHVTKTGVVRKEHRSPFTKAFCEALAAVDGISRRDLLDALEVELKTHPRLSCCEGPEGTPKDLRLRTLMELKQAGVFQPKLAGPALQRLLALHNAA